MKPFKIIVADPPWKMGDGLPGNGRGAASHYKTMPVADICNFMLPICGAPPVADDALLFLWRLAAMPEEALQVVRAWGFTPKSEIVWLKQQQNGELKMGMGRYARLCHETCIIASKGRGIDMIADHATLSVFHAERTKHSKKPAEFFKVVKKLTGNAGPRLELFGRAKRRGWHVIGDEVEA